MKRARPLWFEMLLTLAAPLLLFSSSALDTANNASHENTSDEVASTSICFTYLVSGLITKLTKNPWRISQMKGVDNFRNNV